MTSLELQAESLAVLPQRLETIPFMSDPGASNSSAVRHSITFAPDPGRCLDGTCTASAFQLSNSPVSQQIVTPASTGSTGSTGSSSLAGLLGLGGSSVPGQQPCRC